MLTTILVFLLILSVLVIIHEAGHYFVAKRLGVKVEEFGFGFPLTPALFSKKVGETKYSFYPLLIGGFVKLYGEDEAGAGRVSVASKTNDQRPTTYDQKRAFFSRSVGQRAGIVLAGVGMNTLLAIVIFYVFLELSNFTTTLPLLTNPKFFLVHEQIKVDTTILVDQIAPHSPAAAVGMVAPLQLISINGEKLVSVDQVLQIVKESAGKNISLSWEDARTQKLHTGNVTLRTTPPKGQGLLGVRFGSYALPTAVLTYQTFGEKMLSGIVHPLNLLIYTFDTFGKLISLSLQEHSAAPVSEGVTGPVGVASAVGQQLALPTVKEKILGLLNLSGLISISLAFFNVLPIPALDGGRLFFILFEGVTRKKINPQIEAYIHAVGMVLLLSLLVLVTYNDIGRFFTH